MCGIFGWVVGAAPSPERSELVRLTDLLAHRGPDGGGYELLRTRDGRFSIGLANRRLSILDLSTAGSQPMWSADRRFCLIVVRDLLTSAGSHVRRFLDASIIDGLVDAHLEGRVNNERVLWSLANLERFIRVYEPDLGAVRTSAR